MSNEGLAYAIQNYPPSSDAPFDLYCAAKEAREAIDHLEWVLNNMMEIYDLEYD